MTPTAPPRRHPGESRDDGGVWVTTTPKTRLVGYSDQGGRCDGVQIMVQRGYAYIGHIFSKGFSVVDVRDPAKPKLVKYVAAPPNTWTLHLQAFDDLLLVINNKDMFA